MTRRNSRKPTLTLSLFPFLAVLVCTMGALIVLLVCVVQKARVDAAVVVEAEPEQPSQPDKGRQERLEQLRVQKEDEDWRRQELETQRAELQKKLVQQRLMLSHFEDHIRELEGKWRDLAQQAETLQSLQANQSSVAADQKLAEATERVRGLREQLEKAKQDAEGRHRAFAIVPYDGPNGTSRRPIYIECTDAGVILQPEGIVLSPSDFQGALGAGNPLDASLRTIREYLAKYADSTTGAEPYPLLIVRPSGTIAYAVARAALKSWDDEFGYELIDEEMTLAYPQPDPALKQLVEKSIADARQRQSILAAMMPGRFKMVSSAGIVATSNGGFAPAGGGGFAGGSAMSAGGSQGPAGGGTGGGNASFSDAFQDSLGVGRDGVLTIAGVHNPASRAGGSNFSGAAGGTTGSAAGGAANGTMAGGGGTSAGTAGGGVPGTATGNAAGGTTFGPPNQSGGAPGSGNLSSFPTAMSAGQQPAGDPNSGQPTNTRSTSQAKTGSQRGSSAAQDGNGKPDPNAKPISRYRGPEWGLPNRGPNTTGIQRTITVQCDANRLVLLPEKGDYRGPTVVSIDNGVAPSLESFVSATWKRMETWGIAGDGCYWKPVLRVQVAPDAEPQFQELTRLLQGSGLTVERKP